MKRKPAQRDESGENLALDVLGWLVAEEDRLYPFLNATGITPGTLRERVHEPALLAGVLDHVMGDEGVLVACAKALDVAPDKIAAAWRRLSPPEPEDF